MTFTSAVGPFAKRVLCFKKNIKNSTEKKRGKTPFIIYHKTTTTKQKLKVLHKLIAINRISQKMCSKINPV